jgi:hypothetical protein
MGDSISVGNIEGVGVAIGVGARVEIYGDIHYYPIKLRAPLRNVFKPLIEDRTKLFGGRSAILAKIAKTMMTPQGVYQVITSPAGFGKTALIANLISRTPEAFAYHFFAPLYDRSSLSEEFFLRNVVEQMAQWHSYKEEPPDKLNDLRALYQQFIDEPLDRTQVLVLDGLDEVKDWKLSPYLSRRLPDNLHMIVTIRDVEQDWQAEYQFPSDQIEHMPLGGLDREGVAEVMRAVGENGAVFADTPHLLDKLITIAGYEAAPDLGADPFYVRFLAEDAAENQLSVDNLDDHPQGLNGYLDRWWQEVKQLAGDQPARDLFGTLAVAHGPIRRSDLEAVNPSLADDWAGDFFDEVLKKVRRMVMGDVEGGYALAHPRLRRYMRSPDRIRSIQTYQDRLTDYCADWRNNHSLYALSYHVSHLAEAERIDKLAILFDGEWIAAQWRSFHSYTNLVADLSRAANALLRQDPNGYSRIAAMCVARQTARELMLNFPTELLIAWIRLGETRQVLTSLQALGRAKGSAAETLAAIAGELLSIKRAGLAPAGQPDYADVSTDLLARAIEMLPVIGSASGQMKAMEAITNSLYADQGLREAQRNQLIGKAREFTNSLIDPTLRAVCFAMLASAWASSASDHEQAYGLVSQALQDAERLELAPDRALAVSYLLPTLQRLDSEEATDIFCKILADPKTLTDSSSLYKYPIALLLERWQPTETAGADLLIQLLKKISSHEGVKEEANFTYIKIWRLLCKLGQSEFVLESIDKAWKRSAVIGAEYVVDYTSELFSADPQRTRLWLKQAENFRDYAIYGIPINRERFVGALSYSWAVIGEWDSALERLAKVRSSERVGAIIKCLRLAGETLSANPEALLVTVRRLTALSVDVEPKDLARAHAVASQTLISSDTDAARTEASQAAGLCLASLPAGDTDALRSLLAIEQHESGDYNAAVATIQGMKRITAAIRTLLHLIHCCSQTDIEKITTYGRSLLASLQSAESKPLYNHALLDSMQVLTKLAKSAPAVAEQLDGYYLQGITSLRLDYKTSVSIYAGLAASRAQRRPSEATDMFLWLAEELKGRRAAGIDVNESAVRAIYTHLASSAHEIENSLSQLLDSLQALHSDYSRIEDRVELNVARCGVLTVIDCRQAQSELSDQISAIAELREAPPDALYISRIFGDYRGVRVGPRYRQTRLANTIGKGAVNLAHVCQDKAAAVLGDLMDAILTIDSANDLAQALADFFKNCGNGPAGFDAMLSDIFDRALDKAQMLSNDLALHVVRAAVSALCQLGNLEAAQTIIERIADVGRFSALENIRGIIKIARERLELGPLSAFEQEMVKLSDSELAYAVLHTIRIETASAECLQEFKRVLSDESEAFDRSMLLGEAIPASTALVTDLYGAKAIAELVKEIEDFDSYFLDAASRVGRG